MGFYDGTVDDNEGIEWAILKENRFKLFSLDVSWNYLVWFRLRGGIRDLSVIMLYIKQSSDEYSEVSDKIWQEKFLDC